MKMIVNSGQAPRKAPRELANVYSGKSEEGLLSKYPRAVLESYMDLVTSIAGSFRKYHRGM